MVMPNNRWLVRVLEVIDALGDGTITVDTDVAVGSTLYGWLARIYAVNDALGNGTITVGTNIAVGGTLHDGTILAPAVAAPLTASINVTTVLVQADPDNAISVFVGSATSQSIELAPGQGETLPISDPNLVYVQSAGGAARVNWHAVGA